MSLSPAQLSRILEALEAGPVPEGGIGSCFREAYDLDSERSQVVQRYRRLLQSYTARFGAAELLLARAPGRVNLIGEHTDYNGLPVLPMALNRDIAALFSPRGDGAVLLANTDPAFPERSFRLEQSITPYPGGDWGNYCKAALQGLLDRYRARGRKASGFRGFQAVLDGDIPPAAGLSSSSALVVLSALMFLAANGLDLHGSPAGRLELAELLARAEHYVGTQGGGMDQAVSLLGQAGQALKIDFFPLQVTPAPLPSGFSIVVANSLVQAAKTAAALDKYNRRPIECRLATALLRKAFSDRYRREVPLQLLGDLRRDRLAIAEGEIRTLADGLLHEQPYSLEEIASELGLSAEETARTYCRRRDGSLFPEPADGFKLCQRYRHVSEEGRRVERSLEALRSGDMRAFGQLMNRSHDSCRDLYEISCPELEALVGAARQAGALGSRLTGAGFGGCTVSLVKHEEVGSFIRSVIRSYYRGYLKRPQEESQAVLFPCRAVAGAALCGE